MRLPMKICAITLTSIDVKFVLKRELPLSQVLKGFPAHAWLDPMCNLYSFGGAFFRFRRLYQLN